MIHTRDTVGIMKVEVKPLTGENRKAELLLQLLEKAPEEGLVVEIGCIRDVREVIEDGFSTYYLAKWCHEHNRPFCSFDNEQKAVDCANTVLKAKGFPQRAVVRDGAEALEELGPISFLFLDSHRDPYYSYFQLRKAILVPRAIVVVDDAQLIDGHEYGKAQYIRNDLVQKGIPHSIFDTAGRGRYQWRSLVWQLDDNGKERGVIC